MPLLLKLCVFLSVVGVAWSGEVIRLPNVAVVPVTGDRMITKEQLSFITVKLSGELMRTGAFVVLDRSRMDFILKEQGFQQSGACNSSECQVQVGQLLGMDYIVAGSLVRFGRKYAIHVNMVDVGTGKVKWFAEESAVGELEDVFEILCQSAASSLAKQIQVPADTSSADKRLATQDSSVRPGVIPVPQETWMVRDDMVAISAGCFDMGNNDGIMKDEKPAHHVCLSAFRMDRFEVTRTDFSHTMNSEPWTQCIGSMCSPSDDALLPADHVDWYEAYDYCKKAGKRLPTEAEFEYANRAGSKTSFPWGDGSEQICTYANVLDLEAKQIQKNSWITYPCRDGYARLAPVGSLQPNAWGLYDMTGNVAEWVSDRYNADYYRNTPVQDPQGPAAGELRSVRGGNWLAYRAFLSPGNRFGAHPTVRIIGQGFRCAAQ